ncbi:MAG: BatA domain-containing protein [Gemmataceae bacterium]
MTFIHPLLLGGIALTAIPVVLHLLMRQQPKHFFFPAVRFLQRQVKTNQRKLRLRHLLLLLLRVLLIALMCFALARPRLFSDRLTVGGDQAAVVVLIIDTSASMEYAVAGQARLEAAKARALELLDEVSDQGRVAVLDSAEPLAEWQPSVGKARERVASLQLRPGNQPVTSPLAVAYRLFQDLAKEEAEGDVLPRFVYVFSDRTPNSWDAGRVADLITARDALPDPKPKCVYIDVGVEEPADVAVADLRMRPQVVPLNRPAALEVTVRATGQAGRPPVESEVICRFDGSPDGERKPVKLANGQSAVIGFEKRGLQPGTHTAEVWLLTTDSVPLNNVRYVTFEVREPRKLLILCDDKADPDIFARAIAHQGLYQCEVKSLADAPTRKLSPDDLLTTYKAVFLFHASKPKLSWPDLWDALEIYVNRGGSLAVIPGGEETDTDEYNRPDAARRLMPAELGKPVMSTAGVPFGEFAAAHALTLPFRNDATQPDTDYVLYPRRTTWYWSVKPADKATVLVRYADKELSPAILERVPERSNGRGRVLLFTTPLNVKRDDRGQGANDYNANSFFFVLVNRVAQYLAGDSSDATFNFACGPAVVVPLPPERRETAFTLQGPGLNGSDTQVQRPDGAAELTLTKPQQPGHYTLSTVDRRWTTGFSLNLPPEECYLVPRVAPEAIEKLFGEGAVVAVGQNRKLRDAMDVQLRQPVELFPWLMILLLIALAVENLLSNRFYRNEPGPSEPP